MKKHNSMEYKQNEQEMLALFRKLDWEDQLLLIGRMQVMTERAEKAAPTERGTIIQFCNKAVHPKTPLHKLLSPAAGGLPQHITDR